MSEPSATAPVPPTRAPELSDAELAEIEARAAAATDGPWEIETAGILGVDGGFRIYNPAGSCVAGNFDYEVGGICEQVDVAFIAAARMDVPRLVAALRAAREELMSARAERVELIRERGSAKREADEWWKRSEKQVDKIADLRHIVESAQKAAIAVVYQDRDRTGSGRMGYLNDDDLKPLLAALHVPWPDPADAEEGADRAA